MQAFRKSALKELTQLEGGPFRNPPSLACLLPVVEAGVSAAVLNHELTLRMEGLKVQMCSESKSHDCGTTIPALGSLLLCFLCNRGINLKLVQD